MSGVSTMRNTDLMASLFKKRLEEARRGRMLISEVRDSLGSSNATIKKHIKAGLLAAENDIVGGKNVIFVNKESFIGYKSLVESSRSQAQDDARRLVGGNKVPKAPDGYRSLIEVSYSLGYTLETLRDFLKKTDVIFEYGQKQLIILKNSEADKLEALFLNRKKNVSSERKIHKSLKKILQNEEELSRLGKEPDTQLSKIWGVSTTAVFNARYLRNIPPFNSIENFAKKGNLKMDFNQEHLDFAKNLLKKRIAAVGIDFIDPTEAQILQFVLAEFFKNSKNEKPDD